MILGVDYGHKNIGLAITDEYEKLALILTTVRYKDSLSKIKDLVSQKNISKIILGFPQKGDMSEGNIATQVRKYSDLLKSTIETPIDIILLDESLTTQLAVQNLRRLGYDSKSILEQKDSEAARLILQTYLDNKKS
jgi:putative Holliday junction resolvase